MRLILQKDVKNLGKTGDQVLVKKGYARNFLIPNKLALPLNKNRLKMWKHQNILIEAKKRKAVSERKSLIEKLSSLSITFEKESLKDGKLFGSVTAFEISQALETKYNISVDKKDISPLLLKTAGDHSVTVSLDSEHKTEMTVKIQGKIPKKRDLKTKDSPQKAEPDSSKAENLPQNREKLSEAENSGSPAPALTQNREKLSESESASEIQKAAQNSPETQKAEPPLKGGKKRAEETAEQNMPENLKKSPTKDSGAKSEAAPSPNKSEKEEQTKTSKAEAPKKFPEMRERRDSAETPNNKRKEDGAENETNLKKTKKKKRFFFF